MQLANPGSTGEYSLGEPPLEDEKDHHRRNRREHKSGKEWSIERCLRCPPGDLRERNRDRSHLVGFEYQQTVEELIPDRDELEDSRNHMCPQCL